MNTMEITTTSEVPELSKIVTESGLQKTEGDVIKQSYIPFFNQIAEIKDASKSIDFENPTEAHEAIARELRLKLVKVRTGSEKIKDERKRIHSLKANIEQSAWNLIRDTCQLDEELFIQVEKKREIAEKLRIDNLKSERLSVISELVDNPEIYPLGIMNDEAFSNLVLGLKLAKEAKIKADAEAELKRIELEKAEAADRERIKLENDRLKKEAEEKAAIRTKRNEELKPYIVFVRDYNAMLDLEPLAYMQELNDIQKAAELHFVAEQEKKAELDKINTEQQQKAEYDRKEKEAIEAKAKQLEAELKAKKDAEAKVIADQKAKDEAEKKAQLKLAKAPDRDKLLRALNESTLADYGTLSTEEAGAIAIQIGERFISFKKWAKEQIETL